MRQTAQILLTKLHRIPSKNGEHRGVIFALPRILLTLFLLCSLLTPQFAVAEPRRAAVIRYLGYSCEPELISKPNRTLLVLKSHPVIDEITKLKARLFPRKLPSDPMLEIYATDGLTQIKGLREILDLPKNETQLRFPYRSTLALNLARKLVAPEALNNANTRHDLTRELLSLESRVKALTRHTLIEAPGDDEFTSVEKTQMIYEALDSLLPGSWLSYQNHNDDFDEWRRVDERGETIASIRFRLSDPETLSDVGVNVAPAYQNRGYYYLLMAKVLTENPDISRTTNKFGFDNYLAFMGSIGADLREKVQSRPQISKQSRIFSTDEHRRILEALRNTPAMHIRSVFGFEIEDFLLQMGNARVSPRFGDRFYLTTRRR